MQSRWHRALRSGVATPAHEVLRVVESRSVWMARLGLGLLLSTAACGIPSRRDMMPRRSDVLLKSVEIHPGWRSGCDNECNSTLDTAAAFSATRIDWTFLDPSSAETAAFLRAGAAAGLPVSAAINANMPDRTSTINPAASGFRVCVERVACFVVTGPECENELNCTKIGRVQDLFGQDLTLPWMVAWHDPPMYEAGAAGCVNSPDYEEIKFGYIDSMLAAGVEGFIHDDWQMNTHFGGLHKYRANSSVSFASGCYCEHCMRGFTEYLRAGNASSSVTRADLQRLNVTADWSYKEHALHELSCPHGPHSHPPEPHRVDTAPQPPSGGGCTSAADHSKLASAFSDFQRDSVGLHIARMMAHIRRQGEKLGIPHVAVACNGPTAPFGDLQAARNSTGLSEFDYGMMEYSSNGSLEAMHALVRAFWEAERQRENASRLPMLAMTWSALNDCFMQMARLRCSHCQRSAANRRRTRQLISRLSGSRLLCPTRREGT